MKKTVICMALVLSSVAFAEGLKTDSLAEAGQPAACNPPQAAAAPVKAAPVFRTEKEAKKAFKARRKLIKKLVKEYRRAPEAEKPAVKERLAAVVSEGMDLGLARAKAYIADQRANLERWSAKLAEEEKDFSAAKARRVDDLISGEAERKYKQAQKEWKKQIKSVKRRMR